MSICIAGAAGFAGSGLVKKFLEKGRKVTCIDIISPHMAWNLFSVIDNPNLTYIWKALRDVELEDLEGHDTIVHLAAQADVPMGLTSDRKSVV